MLRTTGVAAVLLFSFSLLAIEPPTPDSGSYFYAGPGNNFYARVEWISDGQGNLCQLNDPTGIYEFVYDCEDQLVQIVYPNGIYTLFSYNPDGQATDVVHTYSDGSPFLAYHYDYDSQGRRILKKRFTKNSSDTTFYDYTPEGYLARVDYCDGDFESYTYDDRGNRLTRETADEFVDYEYDGDLLTRAGDIFYFYDGAGRLTEKRCGNNSTIYGYNRDGLLKRVENSDFSMCYAYDETGDRTKHCCQGDTHYVSLPPVSANFPERIRTPLIYDDDENYLYNCYADTLLATATHSDLLFFLYDYPDGSIGAVMGTQHWYRLLDYEAFGLPRREPLCLPGLTGDWIDPETGFYYLKHRYYDPETGRFITPDPAHCYEHSYAYCQNDPINFTDPLGLWSWGRPSSNRDLMGKNWPGKPPPPPPPPPPGPFGGRPARGSQHPPPPPPQQPSRPPLASRPVPNPDGTCQPYVGIHAQPPGWKDPHLHPAKPSGRKKKGKNKKSKLGHVMNEVGTADGQVTTKGTYRGKPKPRDDTDRCRKEGTHSVYFPVTDEEARRARAKQEEPPHYNLVTNNCGDYTRDVAAEAGIHPPPRTGITIPHKIIKWVKWFIQGEEQDAGPE